MDGCDPIHGSLVAGEQAQEDAPRLDGLEVIVQLVTPQAGDALERRPFVGEDLLLVRLG